MKRLQDSCRMKKCLSRKPTGRARSSPQRRNQLGNTRKNEKRRRNRKLVKYTARGGDVADPWYSERFDVAYRDIYEGCTALLDAVLKQDKQ